MSGKRSIKTVNRQTKNYYARENRVAEIPARKIRRNRIVKTQLEKDFKRNYIHIRDVADCFIHCLQNAEKMYGRPYNAGLDEANLSKEELSLKIQKYLPKFYIHFAAIGSDPDKRNYIVSNQRLREAGFEAKRSLDDGIQELVKGYKLMGRQRFKNI